LSQFGQATFTSVQTFLQGRISASSLIQIQKMSELALLFGRRGVFGRDSIQPRDSTVPRIPRGKKSSTGGNEAMGRRCQLTSSPTM